MVAQKSSEKLEMLKFLYSSRLAEVNFLRERQDKIFSWSSGIFMALIGAMLIFKKDEIPVVVNTIESKVIASFAILVFLIFSVSWQQRNRLWQSENGQVIQKMEHLFHCFDPGYYTDDEKLMLFPSRWADPAIEEPPKFWKRVLAPNYLSATIVLGLLALIMIWLRF